MGKNEAYPMEGGYSWGEYQKLETESDIRVEYHDGKIVFMAGATNRHNEIAGNGYTYLRAAAKKSGCKAYYSDVKLFRYKSKKYLYPDAMVTCQPLDLQSKNGVRSPVILVEVLSKSTRDGDRSFKLREYFKFPSLKHYLLIEQTHCEVQHFRRREDQTWEILIYVEMDQMIDLPEIDLQLSLADLYEDIEFGPEMDSLEEEEEAYDLSVE